MRHQLACSGLGAPPIKAPKIPRLDEPLTGPESQPDDCYVKRKISFTWEDHPPKAPEGDSEYAPGGPDYSWARRAWPERGDTSYRLIVAGPYLMEAGRDGLIHTAMIREGEHDFTFEEAATFEVKPARNGVGRTAKKVYDDGTLFLIFVTAKHGLPYLRDNIRFDSVDYWTDEKIPDDMAAEIQRRLL